jgi:hypothetical protein
LQSPSSFVAEDGASFEDINIPEYCRQLGVIVVKENSKES